jgi:UDP-glucuronate decarboxylase
MVGVEPDIAFRPLPLDDPRRRRPNISRARAILGWKPTTSFQTGLARTIGYFRAKLARERSEPRLSVPASRILPSVRILNA